MTARDFTAADVVQILQRLEAIGVGHWVDGGWGVDALLHHQSRAHDDLDVVIDHEDVRSVQDGLREIGFTHAAPVEPGLPARLVLVDSAGRQVDVHPVIFDRERNGWQRLGGGAWEQYPASGLAGSGRIGEMPVACITAALQLRHHLGYAWSRDDRHDMGLLAGRFGLSLPPED